MPFANSDAALLSFLVACVPLQYFFVQYLGNSETQRSHALHEVFERIKSIPLQYLDWESWKSSFLQKYPESYSDLYSVDFDDPYGESPAVEVMKYRQKDGHFGLSPEPRSIRPPHVKFRVGQVIVHQVWGYRGVIVGWDEKAKAPEFWLKRMYSKDVMKWMSMPNYAILVDERDRLSPQITYVAQEHLNVVTNTKVIHSLLDNHFEKYDGAQYIPRPWLRTIYPLD